VAVSQDNCSRTCASGSNAGDDAVAQLTKPAISEVYKKQLTREEQDVIVAMLQIADPLGKGRPLHIRVPRIAAWAKMEERTVQRTLWGDHRTHSGRSVPKDANGKRIVPCPLCAGLVQRRVLQTTEKANARGKRRPATYHLNLDLLDPCHTVQFYLDQDASRLKFPDPAERPTVAPTSDRRSHDQRPMVAPKATHGRTEVKAFEVRAIYENQSGREQSQKPLSLVIDCTQEENLGKPTADETQLQRVLRLRRQEH